MSEDKSQVKVKEMEINFDMKSILDDSFVDKLEKEFGGFDPIILGFNMTEKLNPDNLIVITHSSLDTMKEKRVDIESPNEENLYKFVDFLKKL